MNITDTTIIPKIADYIEQMLLRKKSSEVGVTQILCFGAYGRIPLYKELKNLQMPVVFMFGDYDWVERSTGDNLISQGHVHGVVHSV